MTFSVVAFFFHFQENSLTNKAHYCIPGLKYLESSCRFQKTLNYLEIFLAESRKEAKVQTEVVGGRVDGDVGAGRHQHVRAH